MMRTHRCGELRVEHAGAEVTIAGWVHHRRDHGKVIFIDLRDSSGAVQVVVHTEEHPEAYAAADRLQREFCALIRGRVDRRSDATINPKMATGEIELKATHVEILSESETPPFLIEDGVDADENLRLKHRYLDLRRPEMQERIRLRSRVVKGIRDYLDAEGFLEIETPILTRSTPEGARDFLVPSRLQPGTFFALPQSPQLYKQLLMVAGLDRYYQIPHCFRDEDLRADRALEFSQLDLEMSFVDEEDVIGVTEGLMVSLWRDVLGVEIRAPFPRIPYQESLRRFGNDKPDLRFAMELTDVASVFGDTTLGIFERVLKSGGALQAILVPGGGAIHHAELRKLEQQAMERGAKGLAWIIFKEGGEIDSPLAKHVSAAERGALSKTLDASAGDLALIVADTASVARTVLGGLRNTLARDRGLIPEGEWRFCWVVDPPLFEWSDEEQRYMSSHHPFTQPQPGWEEALAADPGSAKARAYDIVLNGMELASGSIRIHDRVMQQKVFTALGIDEAQAQSRFGFLLDAFRYGPPPHGGVAPGIDRIALQMAGVDNIREVTAFPKAASGNDPLTGAPTPVDQAQLDELGLRLRPV
ncbi:MAG: aspartate--tRNA ligase [Actinomycetota bacterium]|nr:aspartate--tRNA ligase [Actinomycetota bacterium]